MLKTLLLPIFMIACHRGDTLFTLFYSFTLTLPLSVAHFSCSRMNPNALICAVTPHELNKAMRNLWCDATLMAQYCGEYKKQDRSLLEKVAFKFSLVDNLNRFKCTLHDWQKPFNTYAIQHVCIRVWYPTTVFHAHHTNSFGLSTRTHKNEFRMLILWFYAFACEWEQGWAHKRAVGKCVELGVAYGWIENSFSTLSLNITFHFVSLRCVRHRMNRMFRFFFSWPLQYEWKCWSHSAFNALLEPTATFDRFISRLIPFWLWCLASQTIFHSISPACHQTNCYGIECFLFYHAFPQSSPFQAHCKRQYE